MVLLDKQEPGDIEWPAQGHAACLWEEGGGSGDLTMGLLCEGILLPAGPPPLRFSPWSPASWEPLQARVNLYHWSPHMWPVCPNPILTLSEYLGVSYREATERWTQDTIP